MKNELTISLDLAIVKGVVADYAVKVADIHNVSHLGLAKILREIAHELEKR